MGEIRLWLGPDRFLKSRALLKLRTDLSSQPPRLLEIQRFEAGQAPLADILEAAATLPLFEKRSLIVVEKPEKFADPEQEAVLRFVERLPAHAALVFDSEQAAPTGPFLLKISKSVRTERFPAVRDWEVAGLVDRLARERGVHLSPQARQALAEAAGGDSQRIWNALEQVSLYAGAPPAQVEWNHVRDLLGGAASFQVFELVRALERRDLARMRRVLSDLQHQGKEPQEVVGLLGWHFRRLLQAKRLLAMGRPREEVGRTVRIPAFLLGEFIRQVGGFSESWLEGKMETLLTWDEWVKLGRVQKLADLEILLGRLLGGQAVKPAGKA